MRLLSYVGCETIESHCLVVNSVESAKTASRTVEVRQRLAIVPDVGTRKQAIEWGRKLGTGIACRDMVRGVEETLRTCGFRIFRVLATGVSRKRAAIDTAKRSVVYLHYGVGGIEVVDTLRYRKKAGPE